MRTLSSAMEQAQNDGPLRRGGVKILAYDPTIDKLPAIVRGIATQQPLDLTPFCSDISWSPAQLSLTLVDDGTYFHPDTGLYKKYVMDRSIIRLVEGDTRLGMEHWINTFTGSIKGRLGWSVSRANLSTSCKVVAYSRDNSQAYKRRLITTRPYTVGDELGTMLYDICTGLLGMNDTELRIPRMIGLQFKHRTNQLSMVAPWDGISTLLQCVCMVPFFDGDGRLTAYSKILTRTPSRVYNDFSRVPSLSVDAFNGDVINKVRVVFLGSELEKVTSPTQCLGTATVTSGVFMPDLNLDCWWSDDHKQRAENTFMLIKQSCLTRMGELGSMGGFLTGDWCTEEYHQIDEFHGMLVVKINPLVRDMFIAAVAEYLISAYFGDISLPFGGTTIPVGRIVESLALVQVLSYFMLFGTGNYEFWGTPYDFAYVEHQSVAMLDGLEYWEENEQEIKNDFLGSYDTADNLALTELAWNFASSFPRTMVVENDIALELGDIIQIPDGRKFLITDMSKTFKRGETCGPLTLKTIQAMVA